MQVDELIAAQQLDLTEDEYALLIGVCAHGASWERAEGVLRRMARELTTLQEGTLAAVERYFRHAAKPILFRACFVPRVDFRESALKDGCPGWGYKHWVVLQFFPDC